MFLVRLVGSGGGLFVLACCIVLGNLGCSSSESCDDGIQNGSESDLDCGGSCGPCLPGAACVANEDCTSNGCYDGQCDPTRFFASSPFVLDWPDAVIVPQDIATDSNMVALTFASSYGVPWRAFMNQDPVPTELLGAVDETANLVASLDLPVYLMLTPMANDYKTLAKDSEDASFPNSTLCQDLSARSDWNELRTAYADYVEYMVSRFNPRFLALSSELSEYFLDTSHQIDPTCVNNWAALRDMFNDIYTQQKTRRPDMLVFHTFQIESLWDAGANAPCFGYSETCLTEKLALFADLSMDLFGISTYPVWNYGANGATLPDNYLSVFQDRTGLPVTVAETGWQHSPITIDDPNDVNACISLVDSNESMQVIWMNRLLSEASALQMPLVVWWADHDMLPQEVAANCRCQNSTWCVLLDTDPLLDLMLRFFGSMGLRDYNGNPRPCLAPWQTAVGAASQ